MRENTGRQTVTTINFVGSERAEHVWDEIDMLGLEMVDAYAEAHRENALDPEYTHEYGQAETFEYERAGLRVVALLVDGSLMTVWTIVDEDVARYHTAARTGRTLRIRYVKPDGSVSRRETEVQRVWLSKAGHVMVTAVDRKADDTRNFRADRITHTTLHRATAPVRPSKAALAAAFQAVTVPAPRAALEESAAWYLYDTHPDTVAALEAPESVQDQLAEAFAHGQRYVKVYA